MRMFRVKDEGKPVLMAVTAENQGYRLPFGEFTELMKAAEEKNVSLLAYVNERIADQAAISLAAAELELLVPVEAPEVWAAGVTYQRSREARNYEATDGKLDASTFYDKVYIAERPEIFFKSTAARTVGPGGDLYLRTDSRWQVPEPELGLVLNSRGEILGYTIGNDMSCRDIEGENPLYLPQAKIWRNSCSIGPAILLAEAVDDPYRFQIVCRIFRAGEKVFEDTASTGQLKRKLDELVSYLLRDNAIFDGTVLLTGTCIVPPNEFSLALEDVIEVEISGIGVLRNAVKQQISLTPSA